MKHLSEAEIVRAVASQAAKRIAQRAIIALQRLPDKLSGDDSGLESPWDEICVQVQSQYSTAWDAYSETAKQVLRVAMKGIATYEKEALWLQSDQGADWDREEEEAYPVSEEDTVEYLLHHHVLAQAADWSIRAFDHSSRRDSR